jgi:hypothetical protein
MQPLPKYYKSAMAYHQQWQILQQGSAKDTLAERDI